MEGEVLIKVEGLSKTFCKDLKTSLKYGVSDIWTELIGRKKERTDLRAKEFWAVKDISFEVRRGECLGLIGHNGAGKSTLLKMLNGLINPDQGRIEMRGRIGALIELGAGFSPILTGRENIYNNAAVLGFSKKEVDAKMDEIIEFSEIGEFLDTPVQNYSSGMKVRLGFAIAAQMEPDILIIDEVLAVGDLGFVLKCFKQIDQLLPNTAVIFVSHSMPMISRMCNEIILLDKGKVKFQGVDVAKGIDMYYARFSNNESNVVYTDGSMALDRIVLNDDDSLNQVLDWKSDMKLKLYFHNLKLSKMPVVTVSIYDKEQRPVAIFKLISNICDLNSNKFSVELTHRNLQLSKGLYSINVSSAKSASGEPYLRINNAMSFQMGGEEVWPPFLLDAEVNYLVVK